ncbi:MAG: NAD-dependent epimerase/dehydratase family protein [Deltaproteobacteria bacterium]|nr:NAD-dependent epimerase/dehydratase family protein [Deltaproteobacteria bacterium]
MTRFRAGLVGTGAIAEHHAAALRGLENVELVGVVDLDPARAQAFAERVGSRAYPSLAALREAGASVIHVLTPPDSHADVACSALELGCHVLVEKPLATSVEDCRRVTAAAESRGLQASVNHSLLYDPQVVKALALVRAGKLGEVVSVDILRGSMYPPYRGGPLPPHYRTPGYPFRDLGIHAFYLFEAFLGPIEEARGFWESRGGDPNLAWDEWRTMVRCRRGMGQVQLSWNVRPMQSQIIIQGTRGVLRLDLFLMFKALRSALPLPKPAERVVNALTDSLQPLIDVPVGVVKFATKVVKPYQGLHGLVRAFYQGLEGGRPPPVALGEATSVVRWVEEVARAADADHAARLARLPALEQAEVLVTGASGALGSEVVKRLAGRRVRLLVRRYPAEIPPGAEVVVGDLGDPEAVERAVRGVKAVIHVGAAMKGGWEEHERGTVVGTRNVVEACQRHGVSKLVHVSSMSVVDWAGSEGGVLSERTADEPRPDDRGPYTRAKLEAEKLVRAAAAAGLPAVILRPGQIFGGRLPLLTPAVARRAGRRWLVLGDGELKLPLVYIDDVVDAVQTALDGPLRGGEVIQLVDPARLTQNQVLAQLLGPGAKVVRLPRAFVFAAGRLTEPLLGLLKRKSPVSGYRLHSALARLDFACENTGLLGWQPRVGLVEGVRRMVPSGTV